MFHSTSRFTLEFLGNYHSCSLFELCIPQLVWSSFVFESEFAIIDWPPEIQKVSKKVTLE